MGGKSTFVRMCAVLAVLAQCGSFVPAAALRLRVFDGVFTRMGARDELAAASSSFLVEMGRAADILRAATVRSLVVMDELGR
jgi:DNA mismatch repair ATPase MutS